MYVPLTASLSIGLDALRANPLRAVLSTIGVIIGVAALVGVLSLGDGMERTAREQLASTTDFQTLSVNPRTSEQINGESFPLRDTVWLTLADLHAIRSIRGVSAAAVMIQRRAELHREGGRPRRMVSVTATVPGYERIARERLAAGRFVSAADVDSAASVAVISRSLAREIHPGVAVDSVAASVVGQIVTLGEERRRIIGVLDGDAQARSLAAIVPLRVADPAMGIPRAMALLRAERVEDVATVEQALLAHFAGRAPDTVRRVDVGSYRRRAEQTAQAILIFKLLMGAVTGISLLVGGIGIMNVLLASVTERTREIGIRKAAGARRRDIMLQFLAESVAITGLGAVLGVTLGLVLSFLATGVMRSLADAPFIRSSVSWSTVMAAALSSVIIGLAFGTYPARRAARLSPIEAIRHE
jgi:putative ABC transport system permease protein